MGGVVGWPSRASTPPIGSERTQYWWGTPPKSGGPSGNWWRTRDGAGDVSTIGLANVVTGGAGTYGYVSSIAADGGCRQLFGQENGAPVYQTLAPPGLTWNPPAMDQPMGCPSSRADEVLIFREVFRYDFEVAAPNVNGVAMHGFSLVENLLAGFPMRTTGSWRGIGLAMIGGGASYQVCVKDADPATTFDVSAFMDLTTGRTLVEHRLYRPTASQIGRYELWINEARVLVVPGDTANFPRPTNITQGWCLLPFAMDAPGGTCRILQRAWSGEIIVGPDSVGTY